MDFFNLIFFSKYIFKYSNCNQITKIFKYIIKSINRRTELIFHQVCKFWVFFEICRIHKDENFILIMWLHIIELLCKFLANITIQIMTVYKNQNYLVSFTNIYLGSIINGFKWLELNKIELKLIKFFITVQK